MSSPVDGQTARGNEEEGDVSAGLKVEATGVTVEAVPGSESECAKEVDLNDVCEHMCEEGIDRYREAFSLLWPEGKGFVHKTKLLQFFQAVLGPLYSEEMANCLVEIMEPDDDGNITLENFVQAFSLNYWTPESVAAMHEVLSANPDLVNKLADWKNILGRLGMDMNDQEVAKIIVQAQKGAAALLDKELAKAKEQITNKEEVAKRSTEILDAIKQKMHLMDLGNIKHPFKNPSDASGETSNEESLKKALHLEEPSEKPFVDEDEKKISAANIEEHPVELSK